MEGVTIQVQSENIHDGESLIIQVTAKMVIKRFDRWFDVFQPGERFESDEFEVGDNAMTIQVYLNGLDEEDRGNVSILLSNKSKADIFVNCQFITDVKTFDKHSRRIPGKGYQGIKAFLTHAKCVDAYKEKDFVLTVKIEVPGPAIKTLESAPAPKEQKLNAYRRRTVMKFKEVETSEPDNDANENQKMEEESEEEDDDVDIDDI